jgi:hypothetical protein
MLGVIVIDGLIVAEGVVSGVVVKVTGIVTVGETGWQVTASYEVVLASVPS